MTTARFKDIRAKLQRDQGNAADLPPESTTDSRPRITMTRAGAFFPRGASSGTTDAREPSSFLSRAAQAAPSYDATLKAGRAAAPKTAEPVAPQPPAGNLIQRQLTMNENYAANMAAKRAAMTAARAAKTD